MLATHSPLGEPADPRRDWAREYAATTGRSLMDGLAVYDNAKRYAVVMAGQMQDRRQMAYMPTVQQYTEQALAYQTAERDALAAALSDPTVMGLPEIHSSPLVGRNDRKGAKRGS